MKQNEIAILRIICSSLAFLLVLGIYLFDAALSFGAIVALLAVAVIEAAAGADITWTASAVGISYPSHVAWPWPIISEVSALVLFCIAGARILNGMHSNQDWFHNLPGVNVQLLIGAASVHILAIAAGAYHNQASQVIARVYRIRAWMFRAANSILAIIVIYYLSVLGHFSQSLEDSAKTLTNATFCAARDQKDAVYSRIYDDTAFSADCAFEVHEYIRVALQLLAIVSFGFIVGIRCSYWSVLIVQAQDLPPDARHASVLHRPPSRDETPGIQKTHGKRAINIIMSLTYATAWFIAITMTVDNVLDWWVVSRSQLSIFIVALAADVGNAILLMIPAEKEKPNPKHIEHATLEIRDDDMIAMPHIASERDGLLSRAARTLGNINFA
jgi:hypothetical protein